MADTIGTVTDIVIPDDLKPADGRFGAGPSKIPAGALDALAATGTSLMGTSHRQAPVRDLVGRVRAGLGELFSLPDGYEVVLGNGGATAFWDIATLRPDPREEPAPQLRRVLLEVRQGGRRRAVPRRAVGDRQRPRGRCRSRSAEEGVDVYAWAHNETSTAVMAPVQRVTDDDSLVLIDATSGAGGLPVDLTQVDAYYFAPQKSFASDGGLWLALMSPAALERAESLASGDRWIPAFFDLPTAIDNSRKNQTYNTPGVGTLFLMEQQLNWMNGQGGLEAMVKRTTASSEALYGWAERTSYTTPYVADPAHRSLVIGTIDFDESISADAVAATLRANGIVDTEPYRKLGRNQLRIAMYPAIDPADVEALTGCIDFVVERV